MYVEIKKKMHVLALSKIFLKQNHSSRTFCKIALFLSFICNFNHGCLNTGSSETDPHRSKKEQSSDSVSSLMSMSSHSNCSTSPRPLNRRHSVTSKRIIIFVFSTLNV